nr:transposase [Psychrobacter sp. Rd 27.2]
MAYQNKLEHFKQQGYPIVYMDESGFESETIRSHGYAPIGKPCIDSYNWQGKKRTNVIGALYEKMLFALDYFETNINSIVFYHWCKQTLIPSLKTKCVIVMDNAKFHKSKQAYSKATKQARASYFMVATVQPRPKPYRKEMGSGEVSTPRLDGK